MVFVKSGRASWTQLSESNNCRPTLAYLDGFRIRSLHQHHCHGWSEQDDVGVFIRRQKFTLQVSDRWMGSALPLAKTLEPDSS